MAFALFTYRADSIDRHAEVIELARVPEASNRPTSAVESLPLKRLPYESQKREEVNGEMVDFQIMELQKADFKPFGITSIGLAKS